jgi:hypothetical protein
MKLSGLKKFKTFKTHCHQQHWLNLKKVVALFERGKKNALLLMTLS